MLRFMDGKFVTRVVIGSIPRCVRKLVKVSSDAAEKADVLELAVEKGAIKLSEALAKTTNSMDVHGWTPTILVDQYGHHKIASTLSQSIYPNTIEGSQSTSEAACMSFPSRWSAVAQHPQLTISEDSLEVTCPIGKLLRRFSCFSILTHYRSRSFESPHDCANRPSSYCRAQ